MQVRGGIRQDVAKSLERNPREQGAREDLLRERKWRALVRSNKLFAPHSRALSAAQRGPSRHAPLETSKLNQAIAPTVSDDVVVCALWRWKTCASSGASLCLRPCLRWNGMRAVTGGSTGQWSFQKVFWLTSPRRLSRGALAGWCRALWARTTTATEARRFRRG